jgi:uncharacterized protein
MMAAARPQVERERVNAVPNPEPSSPCTRVCVLDPAAEFCLGCYRTLTEIAEWETYSAEEKRKVLQNTERRRERARTSTPPLRTSETDKPPDA